MKRPISSLTGDALHTAVARASTGQQVSVAAPPVINGMVQLNRTTTVHVSKYEGALRTYLASVVGGDEVEVG